MQYLGTLYVVNHKGEVYDVYANFTSLETDIFSISLSCEESEIGASIPSLFAQTASDEQLAVWVKGAFVQLLLTSVLLARMKSSVTSWSIGRWSKYNNVKKISITHLGRDYCSDSIIEILSGDEAYHMHFLRTLEGYASTLVFFNGRVFEKEENTSPALVFVEHCLPHLLDTPVEIEVECTAEPWDLLCPVGTF